MNDLIEKISLEKPFISRQLYLGEAAGLRPFRKGGIRLEGQKIGDKFIVHNYGHGGAGFSLSYGSGYIASQIAQRVYGSQYKQCAVIGAGYLGIFTAINLRTKGYKVTIYADRLPFQNQSNDKIASQVAPGYWMPTGYDNKDQVLHQVLARMSFQFFAESTRTHRYKGLYFAPCYQFGQNKGFTSKVVPSGLIKDGKSCLVQFGNGVYQEAFKFTSIFANGRVFLTQLLEECKLRKIEIVKKKFNSLEEVLKLNQKFIYNCSGVNAYHLFGDKNIVPVKGTIVYLKKPVDYYFTTTTAEGTITVYPGQRLTIGLSRQQGKWQTEVEKEVSQKIFKNAQSYFKNFNPSPKL